MREHQIKKVNKKNLRNKLSTFELEEFMEEVKEYDTLMKSIGIDIRVEENGLKKKNNFKKSRKIKKDNKLLNE